MPKLADNDPHRAFLRFGRYPSTCSEGDRGLSSWIAISRADRMPSVYDRGLDFYEAPITIPSGSPYVPSLLGIVNVVGNPTNRSETVLAYGAGQRVQVGMILMLSYRVPTEGPWVQFKKPSLNIVPILNPQELKAGQKAALVKAYDTLCGEALLPLPEMHSDPTRIAFDKAIEKALAFPDLSEIWAMLAAEPIVSANPLA
jgi:hypothetical protein